jgi:hypothetical protein
MHHRNLSKKMNRQDNWKPYIRALIYPIQFEVNPVEGVDRVIKLVVVPGALGASPAVYLDSVHRALASCTALARLLPQNHSEAAIRRFLSEVEHRIAAMVDEEKSE